MSSCANKSGLVTGASGGLGRAIVLDLAADGANVVALGRNIEGLRETAARAHGLAGTAEVLQADVTDEAAVISALAEVERRFGSVDFVVNNAGKQIERDLLDTTNEDWETIDATNVRGPFWVCKHAAAAMLRLGRGGSIVNIASVLAERVAAQVAPYAASKAALVQLTRAMALELARHRIRVNALAPGYVETELNRDFFATEGGAALVKRIPQRRLGRVEDLEAPLLLLASDASAYITGATLAVDGGHAISSL